MLVGLSPHALEILKGLPRSLDGRVFPITANALKSAFNRARRSRVRPEGDVGKVDTARNPKAGKLPAKIQVLTLRQITEAALRSRPALTSANHYWQALHMPDRLAQASRIARKWAWLTACNIAGTIVLFLVADLIVSNSTLRYRVIPDDFRIPDLRVHHTLESNVPGALAVWGDRHYRFYTNSLGLRDARVREVATTGEQPPRVLFLGDSFTEGVGLTWDHTIAGQFAAQHPNFEVLNAGIIGYSPSNYLRKTEMLLKERVRIDYVIIYVDISDIQDEALIHFDPLGNIVDGDIVIDPQAQVSDRPEAVRHRRLLASTDGGGTVDLFLPRLRVASYLRRRIRALLAGNATPFRRDQLIKSMWTIPGIDIDYGYGDLGVAGAIDKAVRVMDQLAAMLRDHGIAYYVAVYPWPDQIKYDRVDSVAVQIWRRWCTRNKCAGFVDHFPDFFAHKEGGDWRTLYIAGDVHFSEAGTALAAKRLITQTRTDFSGGD